MLPFEELVGGWALFLLVVEDPDELLTDFKLEVVVSCGDVGTSGGVTGRETGVTVVIPSQPLMCFAMMLEFASMKIFDHHHCRLLSGIVIIIIVTA